jgi:hypothetical protein
MTWDDQPVVAPATAPAPNASHQPVGQPNGLRRAVLTAGMAAALLVTGGVAIVFAASPEPSASAAPGATAAPDSGGTTAPSGGTRQGHNGQPCPNDGGSGSGGSSGSGGGSTTQPSPSATNPAT